MLKNIGCDHLGNLSGLNAWKLEEGFIIFCVLVPRSDRKGIKDSLIK